jgi:PAS domain S-box-containing protein
MTAEPRHPASRSDLRRLAEEMAGANEAQPSKTPSPEEAGRLLHELQVHQIELEMQNEELRRAQAELEASRTRYFDLYDLAPVGYFTVSEQGLILEANLTGAGLLGLARRDLTRQPISHYILPEDQDIFYRHRRQLLEAGTPRECELRMLRAEAAPFWARLESTVAQDGESGESVCRIVVSDIDARKQAEQALADLNRGKDEFLAMLSHELRNPLAPILNAVQLLQLQKNENPIQQKARAIIERQVRQLTHLVNDLLDVARTTTGRIQLCREPVLVSDIVERAVETARPLIDRRRHALSVSLPPDPIWLYADVSRMEQVVTNLLTNAAKYTNEGGHIWLTVRQEGGQAVLHVRDTGVGMAPGFLPHVFDLFTQAKRSSDRSQGGLGIGLALVKRLVEMHEGTVSVSSTLGQGSEFVVRLAVRPPGALTLTPQPATSELPSRLAERALRVLVVDDNVAAAQILEMLVQESGHLARTAHNGPTALAAALDYRPDVMLMDIGLPEWDGYEVAKRIRQEPLLHGIVLAAVTGYEQQADRQHSQQAGFDHHLVKPVDFGKIREILAAAAARNVS